MTTALIADLGRDTVQPTRAPAPAWRAPAQPGVPLRPQLQAPHPAPTYARPALTAREVFYRVEPWLFAVLVPVATGALSLWLKG